MRLRGFLRWAVAFVLAVLALVILSLTQGKVNKQAEEATYRAYRILIHGIFVILVVFVLFGNRIMWSNVEQLSNWFRVEGLVTLVYFARMGHNFYPAEVVVGEIAAISPAIDNHHQPGWQTERRNPPNRDAQRGIAAVEITGNDTRVAAVKRK